MITITKYRAMEGNIKAFFSFQVDKWGDFYVNDCSLIEKNGHRFISFPSRKYEKDGETKYAPYCGFKERSVKDDFEKKVIQAIDEYLATAQPSYQSELPF